METFQQIIQSDTPVLVDFHADWCGPCKAMTPVIKEAVHELDGKARILKVDVDKNAAAAEKISDKIGAHFYYFQERPTGVEAFWYDR